MLRKRTRLPFTPARTLKGKDYFKSNTTREEYFGFIPSYEEKKEKININLIMTNYYMRRWFQERDEFEKMLHTIHPLIKIDKEVLRRRHVQNILKHRKDETILPNINLKRFPKSNRRADAQKEQVLRSEKYKVEYYPEDSKKQLSAKSSTLSMKSSTTSVKSEDAVPKSARNIIKEKKDEVLFDKPAAPPTRPAGARRIKCVMFCPSQALKG